MIAHYQAFIAKNHPMCYTILRWCSILVSAEFFEGGPKNPSKGISMKFLVVAADAQSGVVAGSKEAWAIRNGMRALTQLSWRHVGSYRHENLCRGALMLRTV